jgi:hypothetical protein
MAGSELLPLLLGNNRTKQESNSCYVNSLVQVLRNSQKFVEFDKNIPYLLRKFLPKAFHATRNRFHKILLRNNT